MAHKAKKGDAVSWREKVRTGLRKILLTLAVLVVPAGVAALYHWDVPARVVQKLDTWLAAGAEVNGFTLRVIEVSGQNRTSEQAIREVLPFGPGTPLHTIDMWETQNLVAALPWVKKARVSRHYPDRLTIAISERQPFALWQVDGVFWLVDRDGAPITDTFSDNFRDLPHLVGEGAPESADSLFRIFEEAPDLVAEVKAAIRVGKRRWDIEFRNGARLRLPDPANGESPALAWRDFATLNAGHQLLSRDVAVYDMRLSDRLVVRLTPEGREALEAQKTGKSL